MQNASYDIQSLSVDYDVTDMGEFVRNEDNGFVSVDRTNLWNNKETNTYITLVGINFCRVGYGYFFFVLVLWRGSSW